MTHVRSEFTHTLPLQVLLHASARQLGWDIGHNYATAQCHAYRTSSNLVSFLEDVRLAARTWDEALTQAVKGNC